MPIRWDTLLARHTAHELHRSLVGAKLRAVRLDRSARELTLLFKDRALVWHLHPNRGEIRLHPPVEPTASDHRLRCALLAVETPPDERVIRFEFSATRVGPVTIVVELMSTQWNAVVTEGESGAVRHLLWRPRNDARRVAGQPYQMPPPSGRAGAHGDVSLEDWLAVLGPLPAQQRAGTLVRRFAWTSPLNAAALLGAQAPPDTPALVVGHRRWRTMADAATPAEPVLLELASGLQPYPFPLAGAPSRATATLLAAFEACAGPGGDRGESSPSAVLGPELLRAVERRENQAARRIESLKSELQGLTDPDALRSVGDLILARYHEIPPGAATARLAGFDGNPVQVDLAPGEPAHASAARYYARAAKSERAAERLPAILDEARAEHAWLQGLLERVRAGDADEAEVRRALGPTVSDSGGQDTGPALPYRTFRSSGGLEIRVGRGARHNDDLTFRHSSPGDVWLHARHAAGAHVVLRWQGSGKPPARDLEESAVLAAVHSKARTSGTVPVDWTLRKYVRKPRRAPPGQVLVERVETLFVRPDETLLERLAERRVPD